MKTYRVRDWLKHFENAQSRRHDKLNWVPVPNKHDGIGYARVAAHERAPELLAAWVLILQVASKRRPKEKRGVLADGDTPLTAEDLAGLLKNAGVSEEEAKSLPTWEDRLTTCATALLRSVASPRCRLAIGGVRECRRGY